MITNQYINDTVTASGGDITLSNGVLTLKNTYADGSIKYSTYGTRFLKPRASGSTIAVFGYRTETAYSATIQYTYAAATTFSFNLSQTVANGVVISDTCSITTDTITNTDAKVATLITAWIAAKGYKITVSGAASPLTLTGQTGYPLFTLSAGTNVTVASAMATKTPNGTPGTALAGTTTVTVTTLAAHGLAIGQAVSITTATGYTFTQNGVATVASIANARIASVPSSTTFTLDDVTGSGTNTGTIVITVIAQAAQGTAAQLTAMGLSPTAGASYAYCVIGNGVPNDGGATGSIALSYQDTIWINATTGGSAAAAPAVYTSYKTALTNRLAGLLADGSAADPEYYSS